MFLSLDGNLTYTVDKHGLVSGTPVSVSHNGRRLDVTGRVFRLRIKLPSRVISGSGTANHTITTCSNAPPPREP